MKTNPEALGLPKFADLVRDCDTDKDGQLTREKIKDNKSILSRYDANGEGDHPLPGFFRFLDVDKDGKLTEAEWGKLVKWVGGFKHENALLAIRPGDGGDRKPKIAWKQRSGVPECPSPLYFDGRVYIVKNGGIVSCMDAKSGERHYMRRLGSGGPSYASPVVGNGKIYASSARGVVTVFGAGDSLRILAKHDLQERIMATLAIVDGKLYVRTEEALYAFGLRK